ncbi:MarR family winged helix-turn-helix transcriptional regulator [Terriglobus tenax]|uniref:MarR family winged helix-turn-helix transcriptional regulator n=1 Tax=Terriglobus tenax TaxID=1111115 RepID=UPI0021DF55D0|nr:MarR family transcriptional regulator [Terriglobus tenax]
MSEKKEISATRLWLVMMKSYAAVRTFAEDSIVGTGLGLSDFIVLEMLLHKGPLTMTQIAEKARLANASTTAAIDRLERRNLVHRSFHATDRRVRIAELTPEGDKLIRCTFSTHVRDLDTMMEPLSEADRQALYNGLKKLGQTAEAANQVKPGKQKGETE